MAKALINKHMIEWALQRSGISVEALAERVGVTATSVEAWTTGETLPTFKQAQKFATTLGVPFGYLYLDTPPLEEMPVADFRTVRGQHARFELNTKSLLKDIAFKYDWYKEYREQNGNEPLRFMRRFNLGSDAKAVAADMASVLFEEEQRPRSGNFEDYLRYLINRAEAVGIWVMRTGIVGSNTHRPLSVTDFRGLAIADPVVPLIFINGQDSTAAQIFTFAHELAHIWIGESGISNVDFELRAEPIRGKAEVFSNRVAAEFLTPEDEFRQFWSEKLALDEQVDSLASRFRVSRIVVARRARDLLLTSDEVYQEFQSKEVAYWSRIRAARRSGGDYYRTVPARNGKLFTRAVLQEAKKGTMLLREAGALLGVKPSKLSEIYSRLEA